MRPIGFSTGALAKGDFLRGLEIQCRHDTSAIELSALREDELRPLIAAIPSLDLTDFQHVSIHAPSRLGTLTEREAIDLLRHVPSEWPVIVHPDLIVDSRLWQTFGRQLCLENMDSRKATGRTVSEMAAVLDRLPEASFCFDAGHARQIDPTMATAMRMLAEFAERLVQIHVSEVGPGGEHLPVSGVAEIAFRKISHRVPPDCPIIIESVVSSEQFEPELLVARDLFNGRKTRAIA